MDVTRVPQTPPARANPSVDGRQVGDLKPHADLRQIIDLKEIKTILYLGLRGELTVSGTTASPAPQEHAVDTFA